MTTEQAAEIVDAARIDQHELEKFIAAGGVVWDPILDKWMEAPQ